MREELERLVGCEINQFSRALAAGIAVAWCLCAFSANADTFEWTTAGDGNWNVSTNWTKTAGASGRTFPDSIDEEVELPAAYAGSDITLTAGRTISKLTLTASATWTNWMIKGYSISEPFTFDTTTGNAEIVSTGGINELTYWGGVDFNDPLSITVDSSQFIFKFDHGDLSGGTNNLMKYGGGELALKSPGSYGETVLNEGRLTAIPTNALGTGLVTLVSGTLALRNDGTPGTNETIVYGNDVLIQGDATIIVANNWQSAPYSNIIQLGRLTIGAHTLTATPDWNNRSYRLEFADTITLQGNATFDTDRVHPSYGPGYLILSGEITDGGNGYSLSKIGYDSTNDILEIGNRSRGRVVGVWYNASVVS